MVWGFSFYTPADVPTHVHGDPPKQRRSHDKATETPLAPPVAAPAATTPSLVASQHHEHPVLNSGHSIKHLATQQGYATASDGVRIFYELYECRPRKDSSSADAMTSGCPDSPDPESRLSSSTKPGPVPSPGSAAARSSPGEIHVTASAGVQASATSSGAAQTGSQARTITQQAVQPAESAPSQQGAEAAARQAHAEQARTGDSCAPAAGGESTGTRGEPGNSSSGGGGGGGGCGGKTAAASFGPAQGAGRHSEPETANVLLIMGFAAGRNGWLPLIHHWMCQEGSEALHRLHARFCVFDNRGIGDSDSPAARSSYSTEIMARDALAVMDALGWRRAHVVGFSMGGMIALKLAAQAPQRLLSLTALSVTNGGWQIIPTKWRAIKLLLWAATARTPQQRAHADVHFHFSRDTLHATVRAQGQPSSQATDTLHAQRVEAALIDEYVSTSQVGAPQPQAGLLGQLHAVWNHGLSTGEQHGLRQLKLPVKVVHGYHDMMAMPEYGERLAKHIRAEYIALNGGHFIARECTPEVCMHLADSLASSWTSK